MAKILVIDDSFLQRHILSGFVRKRGHEVVEASGGAEGLALLGDQVFDLVLCDLLMPELSGFEVLDAIRASGNDVPVVIVTADIQETTRSKCLELGASAFLNKPVDETGFFEVVDPVVKKSESA